MAQQATISVYDGASTPVQRTFQGEGIKRPDANTQLALWRELSPSLPLGSQARVSMKRQDLKSGVVVNTLEVVLPVPETPAGGTPQGYVAPPKVAYEDRVLVIQYKHPRSTAISARIARQLALNVAGNVSTAVTVVTSGPWPELADHNIMAT